MDQYAVSSHYELPGSGSNPTRLTAPATTESPAVSPVQYDMHAEHQLVASPSPKRARDSRRKVFDLSGTGDDDVDIDDAAIDESVAIDTHQDTNDDGNDWVTATQHVDVDYDINVDEEEVDVEIEQRSQKQKQQQKKLASKQAPARRSAKSTTTTAAAVSKATQARARSRKPTASAEHLISSDEEEDDGGSKVRRSARTRTRPLEFWRNERPVYKLVYDPKTKGKVPVLKTIEGANQDISSKSENNQHQQQQLQSQRRQQKQSTAASKISKKATTTTTTSTKRQTKSTRVVVENEPAEYDNVADVDEYDNVDANAQLDDIEEVDESEDEEQTLKKRRRKSNEGTSNVTTAVPTELPYLIEDDTGQYTESNAKLVDVVTSQKFRETTGDCKYHSGLEVAGYLSSGVIQIPVGGYKPAKKPVNCALLGHVVQGKVQVTIHRTAVEIGVGCSFVVPPGNPFQIKNVSQKAAKVLLVQTTPHTS
ncbi:hypothetical protein GQ42DRAFT_153308 [Ramicandelaber brevisporus]|nr:hypothetical protein GQ42DRAFT_153308 [Ramicandelaber brevisporus]